MHRFWVIGLRAEKSVAYLTKDRRFKALLNVNYVRTRELVRGLRIVLWSFITFVLCPVPRDKESPL